MTGEKKPRRTRKRNVAPIDAINEEQVIMTTEAKAAETVAVAKKPRAPAKPKTVYAVVEVLDDEGNPIAFDKTRLNLIGIETKADVLLDLLEGGEHPHAMLLKGVVKPSR